MDKKHKLILLIISIFIIIVAVTIGIIAFKKNDDATKLPLNSVEKTKLDNLEDALITSGYFAESNFSKDFENNKLVIDDTYDIFVKNGYYMMNIKDKKNDKTYCNIVDAVEMSLGQEKGKSINTCLETLKGTLNIGGINVEFYDTYRILTVNSEELASLYDISSSHDKNELISIDEINYNIDFDSYLFTSMSTGYTEDIKLFNLCGHVHSTKNKDTVFEFSLYDNNKNKIVSQEYQIDTSKDKYATFCVDYKLDANTVKYYSVVEKK